MRDEQKGRLNFRGFQNDGYQGFYGDQFMGSQLRDSRADSHFGKGPKGYRRSDALILEDANEALYESYDVDATNIEVSVKEGVLSLTGFVSDRKSKRAAEDCVENIDGVIDVENRLSIKISDEHKGGLINGDLSRGANFS